MVTLPHSFVGVFSAINFRLVLCSGRWNPYRLEFAGLAKEGLSEQREREWVGGAPDCPLPHSVVCIPPQQVPLPGASSTVYLLLGSNNTLLPSPRASHRAVRIPWLCHHSLWGPFSSFLSLVIDFLTASFCSHAQLANFESN